MGPNLHKIKAAAIAFLIGLSMLSVVRGDWALASPEYDRVYQLETLGWLRAHDNADGMFAEYLDAQYAQYFKKQSRFVIKKLVGLDDVLGKSSLQYPELIQNPEILKKIALQYRVESLIRTRVYKEADTYRFVLEFVFAPKGDILSTFEFRYIDPGREQGLEGSDLAAALERGLDQLIGKLPFLGQITGVQGSLLTVNLGRNQNIKKNDILGVYTLQSVKRHPVLKTIEEWRWSPVGRVQVEQVEESISFGKVIETEPNQSVIQHNKVREVSNPPAAAPPLTPSTQEKDVPRAGWIAANIGLGSYSREVGLTGGTNGRSGSGLMPQFEIESQVWLNSRWITQLSFSGMFATYTPTQLTTGAEIGTQYRVSGNQFRIAAGYSLFPAKTIFDSIGWIHAGYRFTSYSIPTSASDFTGASEFGTVFIGIGGEIPFEQVWSAQLGLDLGLLRSASQTQPNFGDVSASTDLLFHTGLIYRLKESTFLRLNFKISSQSMDFLGGQSVSQKMFSISPSVMYYF